MRLLVDGHVLDDLSQGSKTYLNGLYNAVFKVDHQTEYYVATNHLSSFQKGFDKRFNVHHLQYKSHNKFLRLGWEIPRAIRANKLDWAHYQYISPALKTSQEIVTIHDLLFLDYPEYFPVEYRVVKNFLFKRSARRAEWVLTVSEHSKNALVRHYDISPEKIIITPNGILDLFWEESQNEIALGQHPFGIQEYILYVSRIEPRKNQLGLLRAYLNLKLWDKGIQLVFVGGVGIKTPEFDSMYENLSEKVKGMIVFLRDVPAIELKWLYKNCLLFVYPSFAEGFGIPPLEALACGANVICSNTTAMAEFDFLKERSFDPNVLEEMTQKIEYFLDNPDRARSGITMEFLKTHYSWETAARRFLAIFK